MSTPYSNRTDWALILLLQLQSGVSRFQGPAGLLTEMERLFYSSTAEEITSMFLTRSIPVAKTNAG